MDYRLASTVADLQQYLEDYRGKLVEADGTTPIKVIAHDTETTSLNTRLARLVGQSVSLFPETAIYIPHAHQIGTNVPTAPIMKVLDDFIKEEGLKSLYYNAKYDRNVLQGNTGYVAKDFEDVLEVVYLENPDRKRKGLKLVAAEDLGHNMEKFDDLFTAEEIKAKDTRIDRKAPARCTNYACADADETLQVWLSKRHLREEKGFKFALQVDTPLVDVVRKMEHNGGAELNEEYIEQQIAQLNARAEALREQVHRMAGQVFEINSPKQLGDVLFGKLGLPSPGLTRGKNPQHITNEEALEKLSKAYPIVEFVIAYRKIVKAESSYFRKLKTIKAMKMPIRFQFNIYAAPTFRFAAPGGDPEKDGGTGINIQAVSNGEARSVQSVDLALMDNEGGYSLDADEDLLVGDLISHAEEEGDPNYDLSSLPWVYEHEDDPEHKFCIRETCAGCPAACASRGIDTTRRVNKGIQMVPSVRQAFRAPKGYTILSFDYDRQELVIGANLSGEPKWLNALANNVDLHVVSAAGAFGVPPEQIFALAETDKHEFGRRRGIGKTLNFAVFYGATGYTLATKANIPIPQGERMYDEFKRNHPTLFGWISKCHIFSRKNGYTTTYFGRRRDLSHIYKSADRKMQAFGDRSAVNTAVQGTAAEVTRIAMIKVDAMLRREGVPLKDCRFFIQLHDDLSFIIRDELVPVLGPKIKAAMEFHVKNWQVQLSVGAKVGRVWGTQEEIGGKKARFKTLEEYRREDMELVSIER